MDISSMVIQALIDIGSTTKKGFLHVQEPKNVPHITKNYSKEPLKKVLKWF